MNQSNPKIDRKNRKKGEQKAKLKITKAKQHNEFIQRGKRGIATKLEKGKCLFEVIYVESHINFIL